MQNFRSNWVSSGISGVVVWRDGDPELLRLIHNSLRSPRSETAICEKGVQEFWDYDAADCTTAEQISHNFKATRESSLRKRC